MSDPIEDAREARAHLIKSLRDVGTALGALSAAIAREESSRLVVHLDLVAPGSGLIHCSADERLDGITGRDGRRYYAEAHDVTARAGSAAAAVRALARRFGYDAIDLRVDREF